MFVAKYFWLLRKCNRSIELFYFTKGILNIEGIEYFITIFFFLYLGKHRIVKSVSRIESNRIARVVTRLVGGALSALYSSPSVWIQAPGVKLHFMFSGNPSWILPFPRRCCALHTQLGHFAQIALGGKKTHSRNIHTFRSSFFSDPLLYDTAELRVSSPHFCALNRTAAGMDWCDFLFRLAKFSLRPPAPCFSGRLFRSDRLADGLGGEVCDRDSVKERERERGRKARGRDFSTDSGRLFFFPRCLLETKQTFFVWAESDGGAGSARAPLSPLPHLCVLARACARSER